MNITQAAIEKNRITAFALILILLAGLMTFQTMPRAEDPGFIIRAALILTYFPGAAPERVEMLITDKLEKAIQEMPELDYVMSESITGVSVIYVIIKQSYKKMRPIWDSLRRKVDRVKGDLPEGVVGPFVNDEFGDVFGTNIAITGEGYSYLELKKIADEVRDELLLVEEVAKVDIYGAQEERIFIEYNDARLAEVGLSASQLIAILQSQNIVIPGGNIDTGMEKIVLEPSGSFESVEDLKRTLITIPGRRTLIYLEDLADVSRGYIDPPQSIVHSSGIPALVLAINMREGGNIIVLGEKVREQVNRLQSLYPIGIEFDIVAFQPDDVNRKIKSFQNNLFQAIAIVILVMLATLGIRTGLVVASLVPMAMIMSILIMSFFYIGLDQMSIASLIIALGLLVDNAIVMSESIMVQISAGKKAVDAAIDSARELRMPLLIASLTTSAAFLPIYLAESDVGEYTAPLFKVVTITLISSWILSQTITPMFSVYFLKVKKRKIHYDSGFYRRYRGFLLTLLRNPILTLIIVTIVFLTAMQGFKLIPNIFMPRNEKAMYTAEFELPKGSPIHRTESVITEIETFMHKNLVATPDRPDGIVNWSTYIGQGAPRFFLGYNPEPSRPEYAIMIINTTSNKIIDALIQKTEEFCLERFPDLYSHIDLLQYGPPTAAVEVRVSGKDLNKVFQLAERVKAKLAEMSDTRNIRDDWGRRTKKIFVKINQTRARRAGVTNRDIAISLQTALAGIETTQYREEDKAIPIVLRSIAAGRQDIGKLEAINVYAQLTGKNVPLRQVADLEIEWESSKILRRSRLKTVTVKAEVTGGITPIAFSQSLDKWLKEDSKEWGIGYRYELGGEIETSGKANAAIGEKLPIAFLIIILLLVIQFNSIRRPIIILVTIPLGLIGVVFGLIVARSYFGFMTLLGVVSLAGIVVNNAIVLLDRIRIEIQENGLDPARAVIESAQKRLRPILLTTATTIGGLLPLWIGGGPMYEPMAITIIFGLLFSTLLTLGVVPVLYSIFFRVKFKGFEF
ncbi:MAG: MMPL family transporter [Candidatus Aminicenantes bacterium]|nr:MMPL family transporter [Candidatus Aminicenantes bacterium]